MGGRYDCADVDEDGIEVVVVIEVIDVVEVVEVVEGEGILAPLDLLNLGSAKNSSTLKRISLKRATRNSRKK